jgi:hypothetical protein
VWLLYGLRCGVGRSYVGTEYRVLEYEEPGDGIGIGGPGYTKDESLNFDGCKGWLADRFAAV